MERLSKVGSTESTVYPQMLEESGMPSDPPIVSCKSPDMPDMEEVLMKFRINPAKLKSVNLNDYYWWKFNTINIPSIVTPPSPTISQRIYMLGRKARNQCTHSLDQ